MRRNLILFRDGLFIGISFSTEIFAIVTGRIAYAFLVGALIAYYFEVPKIETPEQRITFAAGVGIGIMIGMAIIQLLPVL